MTVYFFLKALTSIHTEVTVTNILDDAELWKGEAWEIFDHKKDNEILNAKIYAWDYISTEGATSIIILI